MNRRLLYLLIIGAWLVGCSPENDEQLETKVSSETEVPSESKDSLTKEEELDLLIRNSTFDADGNLVPPQTGKVTVPISIETVGGKYWALTVDRGNGTFYSSHYRPVVHYYQMGYVVNNDTYETIYFILKSSEEFQSDIVGGDYSLVSDINEDSNGWSIYRNSNSDKVVATHNLGKFTLCVYMNDRPGSDVTSNEAMRIAERFIDLSTITEHDSLMECYDLGEEHNSRSLSDTVYLNVLNQLPIEYWCGGNLKAAEPVNTLGYICEGGKFGIMEHYNKKLDDLILENSDDAEFKDIRYEGITVHYSWYTNPILKEDMGNLKNILFEINDTTYEIQWISDTAVESVENTVIYILNTILTVEEDLSPTIE